MAAADDFKILNSMADWLGFDGENRDNFISASMKAKGHKSVLSWADSDDGKQAKKEDNPFDSLFSDKGKGQSESKDNKGSSSGWQY